jgi:mycothiol S-conjugate amidase
VARYRREGVRTTLVCCTGGEEGDVNNPAMLAPGGPFHGLTPEQTAAELARRRPAELAKAAEIIGYGEVVMLGYRDSGMAESETNANPECFHQADLDEAVGRLVGHIRRTRPQVILTYSEDHSYYPHPDHVRVHDISVPAFERAGDPDWYPEAGEPWQPSKLYYSVWSHRRIVAWHEAFGAAGLESPFDEKWLERPSQDERVTTRVSVDAEQWRARNDALLAHETQVDPTERFWFGLPFELQWQAYPWEDWVLARSLVPRDIEVEDDLFHGLRHQVRR